ncbi:MAG: hypothetical protein II751_06320 [Bacteroidales bacterium]|nr:hypothetical protein [Bacteroidales bacterium]
MKIHHGSKNNELSDTMVAFLGKNINLAHIKLISHPQTRQEGSEHLPPRPAKLGFSGSVFFCTFAGLKIKR